MSLDGIYLIWSHEHRAWWGPGGMGYVQSMSEAGHYTRERALLLCAKAIPGTADRMGALPELPIPLRDVLAFTSAFLTDFPGQGGDWK